MKIYETKWIDSLCLDEFRQCSELNHYPYYILMISGTSLMRIGLVLRDAEKLESSYFIYPSLRTKKKKRVSFKLLLKDTLGKKVILENNKYEGVANEYFIGRVEIMAEGVLVAEPPYYVGRFFIHTKDEDLIELVRQRCDGEEGVKGLI